MIHPPWADFSLSDSRVLPAKYKVVLFDVGSGTIQISEYSAPAVEKILWRTKSDGFNFRFDNGVRIPEGNYYCGFEAFVSGDMKRIARVMLDDNGRYEFFQKGNPILEEDISAYSMRRKRDRLNNSSLIEIAKNLNLQLTDEKFWIERSVFSVYEVENIWYRPAPSD